MVTTGVQVDQRVTMTTVRVDPIEVELSWVRRADRRFVRPPRVTARFVLQYDQFERAVDWGAFHLDEAREPPGFEAGRPVELRARLRPALARGFPEDEGAVLDRVTDATDPVRHTEAWFGTELLQSVPMPDVDEDVEATAGRQTRWADPGTSDHASEDEDLLAVVTDHLDAEGWTYERVQDDLVRFDVALDDERYWTVLVSVREDARRCTIHSGFPERVPEGDRADAALRLAEWNYELDRGAFVLDPADGELRFRTHVVPDEESVGAALDGAVVAMGEFYDDLAALADGDEA